MTAGAMSDGSPVSPELDARLLADLREWRARLIPGGERWSARLTIDELDMLLRVAAERDALKAAACAEWEAEIPAEIRERAGIVRHVNAPCSVVPILDECQGCAEDIAGGYGLYCSACGKPRPKQ